MKYAWGRRRWLDFRQGHGLYLIFALSFANFILIFHRLLIERIDFLGNIFSELWVFGIVFLLLYIPVAVLVGFWHRRTQIKVEAEQVLRQNPVMAKNFRILIDIMEKRASKEEIEKYRDFLCSIEAGKGGKVDAKEKSGKKE